MIRLLAWRPTHLGDTNPALRDPYSVGSGLGPLQRWLATYLPPVSEQRDAAVISTVARLATEYYRADIPTHAQIQTIRQALRRLEERGLAQPWPAPPGIRGKPWYWTQPEG
jgi:hypothetical protein